MSAPQAGHTVIGRKLRFGMVGGGRDAFIGAVHRAAACMDGEAELVAGAFSSDAQRAKESAAALAVPSERAYGSFAEMAAAETAMPASRRLDFIVIVTPNDQHFAPAKSFLENGFNVVIEKPVAFDLDEALRLRAIVSASRKVFVLTHAYTGHAMVRQARDLVRSGELGAIRKVIVEYSQGWLSGPLEASGHKQALWRTDPRRSGAGGSIGDIGTHAAHLAHYITGLRIDALAADLSSFVQGRRLDDDASMLIRYQGGAKGVLHCSQVSVGEENDLNIRAYGEKAALEWRQEHPDQLIVKYADRPRAIWSRASPYTSAAASRLARVPPGHPEGYLEAFANIYREAFRAIRAGLEGKPVPPDCDFPTIDDGVDGMRFIEAALESARLGSAWVRFGK